MCIAQLWVLPWGVRCINSGVLSAEQFFRPPEFRHFLLLLSPCFPSLRSHFFASDISRLSDVSSEQWVCGHLSVCISLDNGINKNYNWNLLWHKSFWVLLSVRPLDPVHFLLAIGLTLSQRCSLVSEQMSSRPHFRALLIEDSRSHLSGC